MPAHHPSLSFRVLIVDDNDVCSDILARMIQSPQLKDIATVHITTLHSAEEALRDLQAASYDIIFTDIEMGQVWGDEMTRIIRSDHTIPIHKKNRDIPIVAVTARVDPASRERYSDMGISECIAKPFKMETIHKIIRERTNNVT